MSKFCIFISIFTLCLFSNAQYYDGNFPEDYITVSINSDYPNYTNHSILEAFKGYLNKESIKILNESYKKIEQINSNYFNESIHSESFSYDVDKMNKLTTAAQKYSQITKNIWWINHLESQQSNSLKYENLEWWLQNVVPNFPNYLFISSPKLVAEISIWLEEMKTLLLGIQVLTLDEYPELNLLNLDNNTGKSPSSSDETAILLKASFKKYLRNYQEYSVKIQNNSFPLEIAEPIINAYLDTQSNPRISSVVQNWLNEAKTKHQVTVITTTVISGAAAGVSFFIAPHMPLWVMFAINAAGSISGIYGSVKEFEYSANLKLGDELFNIFNDQTLSHSLQNATKYNRTLAYLDLGLAYLDFINLAEIAFKVGFRVRNRFASKKSLLSERNAIYRKSSSATISDIKFSEKDLLDDEEEFLFFINNLQIQTQPFYQPDGTPILNYLQSGYPQQVDGFFPGQVQQIMSPPKPRLIRSSFVRAYLHPDFASKLLALRKKGVVVVFDHTLVKLGLEGVETFSRRGFHYISISPKSNWSAFIHEADHIDFDLLLADDFSQLRKHIYFDKKPLSSYDSYPYLVDKYGTERLNYFEQLVKNGHTETGVAETLAFRAQLKEAGFVEKYFIFRKYNEFITQYQLEDLFRSYVVNGMELDPVQMSLFTSKFSDLQMKHYNIYKILTILKLSGVLGVYLDSVSEDTIISINLNAELRIIVVSINGNNFPVQY